MTQEILNQLELKEKDFLIKSSIFNYFDVEVCNNILNINNSEELIQSLINKNLFIVEIDNEKGIYRYHNLFKEFLNIHFNRLDKQEQKNIRLEAYKYFVEIGEDEEGIKHLLEIKYYDEVVNKVKAKYQNVKGWAYLKRVPIEYILKDKDLVVQMIFYYYSNLDINSCKELISNLDSEESSIVKVCNILIGKEYVRLNEEDFESIDQYNCNDITKGILYLNVCYSLMLQNDFKMALNYCYRCYELGKNYRIIGLCIFCKGIEASILEELGDFFNAERTLDVMKELIINNEVFSNLMFMYNLSRVGLNLKMAKIEEASKELKLVCQLSEVGKKDIDDNILINLAEMKIQKGDIDEGINILNELADRDKSYLGLKLYYMIINERYTKYDLEQYVDIYNKFQKNNKVITLNNNIIYARAIYLLGQKEEAKKILKDVLKVLAQGLTNKEIGQVLNISLATVKTHIVNIYSKLGVSNRIQAIERAKGIIDKNI